MSLNSDVIRNTAVVREQIGRLDDDADIGLSCNQSVLRSRKARAAGTRLNDAAAPHQMVAFHGEAVIF